MTKAYREWIEESELPAEVKAAALYNIENFPLAPNVEQEQLCHVINVAFDWPKTIEGIDYWKEVFEFLYDGGNPALCPLPPLHLPAIPWEFVKKEYNYHAFDADGDGVFYAVCPTIEEKWDQFKINEGDHNSLQYSSFYLKTDQWRKTIQHRPK